jgi:hypothetical protein
MKCTLPITAGWPGSWSLRRRRFVGSFPWGRKTSPRHRHRKTTFRSITVDGEEFEFSGGFADLHTAIYREILAGRGFGIEDSRPSIDLVYELGKSAPVQDNGPHVHPFLNKP